MSFDKSKGIAITERIADYMSLMTAPMADFQKRLVERTDMLGGPSEMRIPHQQSVLLTVLARALQARCIVEVGTFTGYSTVALAKGLAPGGRVITCDLSQEWTDIALDAFRDAGVEDRIDLRLGPAKETLARLPHQPMIDMAFLDADKTGYIRYWDEIVPRLRQNAILVADNVLYAGEAANKDATGNAAAIRAFNAHASRDPRVTCVMLPVADGILLAQRL